LSGKGASGWIKGQPGIAAPPNEAMVIVRDPVWKNPPEFIESPDDEVHVWRASLDLARWDVDDLHRLLSADERERAGRFRFERDRDHFIVGRARLRILLGRYLGKEPGQFEFTYNSYGKPFLADEKRLSFNLSHSHGLALYAIARGRQVGIDLEQISERVCIEEVARSYFSPTEVAAIRALPEKLRRRAFFNCWTRKEAYLKAQGNGLSITLDSFSVSLNPGEPAALLDVQTNPEETARWSLMELRPDPRYAAALAVEGRNWGLKCWELTADIQKLPSTAVRHTMRLRKCRAH
jgi:4'-phosphopantetheinyl transferase